jgi:hypothetical protein
VRILIIDHGCCDHPHTRVHRLREALVARGHEATVCGPSSVSHLEQQQPGLHGIHLHDVAAASRKFLAAVQDGSAGAFLETVATVPSRLLGLVRETARQMIAEAADALYPDVIFVLHAGILTDLAVETGAPVVVHVSAVDLSAADARPSLRRLVAAAIDSSSVVAADEPTATTLVARWLHDATAGCDVWPADAAHAEKIEAACEKAVARRRGP